MFLSLEKMVDQGGEATVKSVSESGISKTSGLYQPDYEHDACGVGFIAHMKGEKSHSIIEQGLLILKNLNHRGAVGADPKASDGAGLLRKL